MNYFELGFLTEAQDRGYQKEVAEAFLKRASENPTFSSVVSKHPEVEEQETYSFTPDALLQKFKQDFIHDNMNDKKIKINL
jgi:hypothetical protein